MRRLAFLCALSLSCATMCSAEAARPKADPVQDAVDLIETNPAKAEAQLKKLQVPSAYAYLAFIYMSNRVKIANREKTIDALMKKAKSSPAITDSFALQADGTPGLSHYKNMAEILRDLRFICDASEETAPIAPCFIFKEYPREAFRAYDSAWGSSRDARYCGCDPSDRIKSVPEFKHFIDLCDSMAGVPSWMCAGTIHYAYDRHVLVSEGRAVYGPRMFLAGRSQDEKDGGSNLLQEKFLEKWSNQELWNKIQYKAWLKQFGLAESALSAYYRKSFGLKEDEANKAANVALWHVATACLGIFSESDVEEQTRTDVYKCFSQENLDLAGMKAKLGDKALAKDELNQALSLAILNGASADIVQELLARGASIKNKVEVNVFAGSEPPLFSAVLRSNIVDLLIKAGADVNEKNMLGKTALIQAVQYNCLDSAKLLIAAGAKVNDGMIPADCEESTKANDTCFYNYTVGQRTPLMYACSFAGPAMVRFLIESGADKNAKDSKGASAASYLADNKSLSKADHDAIAQLLK